MAIEIKVVPQVIKNPHSVGFFREHGVVHGVRERLRQRLET